MCRALPPEDAVSRGWTVVSAALLRAKSYGEPQSLTLSTMKAILTLARYSTIAPFLTTAV